MPRDSIILGLSGYRILQVRGGNPVIDEDDRKKSLWLQELREL
jgi:hypothetical protein